METHKHVPTQAKELVELHGRLHVVACCIACKKLIVKLAAKLKGERQ